MILVLGPAMPIVMPSPSIIPFSDPPLARSIFGILDGAEVVAGHEHVVGRKMNQRVAIGVRAANRNEVHVFAVHVDGHRAFVGHHRQRGGGSGDAGRAVRSGDG